MFRKAKELSLGPIAADLLEKLLMSFAVLYVVFFAAEMVLPGVIMDVFNINILLFFIFGLLFLLAIISGGRSSNADAIKIVRAPKYMLIFLIAISLSMALVVALYRVSFFETLIYLILVFVAGGLMFGLLKK